MDLQSGKHLCDVAGANTVFQSGSSAAATVDMDRGVLRTPALRSANQDRPDVMTAGALKFWQEHAQRPSDDRVRGLGQITPTTWLQVFRNA